MRKPINPLISISLVLVSATSLPAATLYWNANSGSPDYSGEWDETTNNWNTDTAGAGSQTSWFAADDAVFDVDAAYTASLNADQTATTIQVSAGDVTLDGTNTVSSTDITIDSGAALSGAGDRYLKVGTTSLTVDGTLDYSTAVSASNRRVSLAGGSGEIILGGALRIGGAVTFDGNISGVGALITDAGGVIALSGDNTYSGDTLFRTGNTVRLGSATALSSNSFLRTGGGCVFELTGTDFSRQIANSGAGNMRVGNAADVSASAFGFAAVDADRSVALTGTVLWGSTTFNPTVFNLGTGASTHKVTLTTDIDLNGASRTINSANGPADVEGEISGIISGADGSILNKTGNGVLLLSNANTHPGGTTIAGSQGSINRLRISNSSALGSGSLTIGGGGNNDQSRLELTGDITITNTIPALTSRNNDLPNIVNVSGNNTVSTNISSGGGGNRTTFESAADKLTFGGSVSVRQLNLFGEGDGEISGNVTIASGGTPTYILNKAGSGKWTIGGNMSNSGGATIAEGTLQIGKGGSTGSLGVAPIVNNGVLIFDRTGTVSVPGVISGSGSIIKRGTSAITLSGAIIEYTGDTTIEDGALLVTGDATNATGAIAVGDGIGDPATAILGGTGVIGGSVTMDSDGTIAPGVSAGILDILGDVSGTGSLAIEIDGATADQLYVDGTLDISAMTLDVSTLNEPTEPVYIIVDASSAITGMEFASVTGMIPAGYTLTYNYDDGSDAHNIALVGGSGSPFDIWATANGLAGGDAEATADPDHDGLDNAMEFVVGGQPNPANANANSSNLLPTVAVDSSDLVFTYRRTHLSLTQPGIGIKVEYGSDLSGWNDAVDGEAGVTIVANVDPEDTSADIVVVTIPKSANTLFARLNVVNP